MKKRKATLKEKVMKTLFMGTWAIPANKMTFERHLQDKKEGNARLYRQLCAPQRSGQRPWDGVEGLVMCLKLISEYLLGLDYNVCKLLLDSGYHLEIILHLRYLAMSEGILLNTCNPQESNPIHPKLLSCPKCQRSKVRTPSLDHKFRISKCV